MMKAPAASNLTATWGLQPDLHLLWTLIFHVVFANQYQKISLYNLSFNSVWKKNNLKNLLVFPAYLSLHSFKSKKDKWFFYLKSCVAVIYGFLMTQSQIMHQKIFNCWLKLLGYTFSSHNFLKHPILTYTFDYFLNFKVLHIEMKKKKYFSKSLGIKMCVKQLTSMANAAVCWS